MPLNRLETQLSATIAKTMHADPGLIEDALVTALSHKGRAVRVAVGEGDHLLLRRHWQFVRQGRRIRVAKKWTVRMYLNAGDTDG